MNKKKINQAGYMDIEKYSKKNYEIKFELEKVKDDLYKKNKELINMEKDKNKQIEKYIKEIESLKNDIKDKSDKLEELNTKNSNLQSNNKQLYLLSQKNEILLNEEKEKNRIYQEKLKIKESELIKLQELYKNMQIKNDNLLKEYEKDYEKKINELTKKNNELLSTQNNELVDKSQEKTILKSSALNLSDLVKSSDKESQDESDFYINENKKLKEEINKLKEEISNQAHDLVEMNSLEKNLEIIRIKNKDLSEKYNKLKKDYDELKNQNSDNNINYMNNENKTCIFGYKNKELEKMKAFRSVLNLSIRKSQNSSDLKKEEKNIWEQMYKNLKQSIDEQKKFLNDKIEKINM